MEYNTSIKPYKLSIAVRSMGKGKFVDYIIDLHKQYGPIVSIKAGVLRLVYINDGKLLAYLYHRDEFAVRPIVPAIKKMIKGEPRGKFASNALL